ncbi:MAG: peptidoglycan D,D-transpeptidase FtsI family protein [Dehalococcoidia bacterium]
MGQKRLGGSRRILLPAGVIAVAVAALVARLVSIQIVEHDQHSADAKAELADEKLEYGRRGTILDRNGTVLAASVPTFDVYISGKLWQDPAVAQLGSTVLTKHLKLGAGDLLPLITSNADVRVARDIDWETGLALAAAVKEAELGGAVRLDRSAVRIHPNGSVGASLVGWYGDPPPDDKSRARKVGRSGIESNLNGLLAGKPLRTLYERDTEGEAIPIGSYVASAAEDGADVVLALDWELQDIAERELEIAVAAHKAIGGTVVMMEPETGRILALATLPRLKYTDLPFKDSAKVVLENDKSVSYAYEPGSVMKVITAAAAVDAGVVGPDTWYHDDGVVRFEDGTELKNWRDGAYGDQSMVGVLQNSINTGAIFMQRKLGRDRFLDYLDRFGFNDKTGIELPAEAAPFFRQPGDEGWTVVDVATQSYGQGIFVTPVQMVAAFAATINGGQLFRPQLVRETVDADGTVRERRPDLVGHPIRPETSATMRSMLAQIVMPPERGHQGKPRDYSAGGKSGTANIITGNTYDEKRQVASFIGFAPVDAPKIVILVKLDENADLQTGQEAAGPVFAKLVDLSLAHLNVAPDAATYVMQP